MKHKSDKVEIYQSRNKEWRWRVKARNGRIVAASSEGFKTKAGATNNIRRSYNCLCWHFFNWD